MAQNLRRYPISRVCMERQRGLAARPSCTALSGGHAGCPACLTCVGDGRPPRRRRSPGGVDGVGGGGVAAAGASPPPPAVVVAGRSPRRSCPPSCTWCPRQQGARRWAQAAAAAAAAAAGCPPTAVRRRMSSLLPLLLRAGTAGVAAAAAAVGRGRRGWGASSSPHRPLIRTRVALRPVATPPDGRARTGWVRRFWRRRLSWQQATKRSTEPFLFWRVPWG